MLQICKNPNLVIIKFGEILSICSQDIEQNEILKSNKGHNSVTKVCDNDPT